MGSKSDSYYTERVFRKQRQKMEYKIGDVIITCTDKKERFGDLGDVTIPKGSEEYVCEIYDDGSLLIEFAETDNHHACVIDYDQRELSLKEPSNLAI